MRNREPRRLASDTITPTLPVFRCRRPPRLASPPRTADARPLCPPAQNRLLAALSPDDYARLAPRMEDVTLGHRDTLYRLNGRLDFVYFPTSGVMSSVLVMLDGRTMEVGATGREGMVGLTAVLGADRSPEEVF